MKKAKKGSGRGWKALVIIGILVISAGIGLVLYNIWDGKRAERASNLIAEQLETEIDKNAAGETPDNTDSDQEMPTIEIDGKKYIGILEVPVYNLRLPVMADWSYASLKISPCRYSGSYYTNDLVICGHNYARHFSPLKNIGIGEKIRFTSVEGKVYTYMVGNRETLRPTEVSKMVENKSNSETQNEDWDLTLFTCNTGGRTRCAVRCVLQDDSQTNENASSDLSSLAG